MLAELVRYSERTALIMRSGIQFMDFGLTFDLRQEPPGEFVLRSSNNALARLEYQERDGSYVCPGNPPKKTAPSEKYATVVDESFKLLEYCWLPVPYLRTDGDRGYAGPTTWARGRIVPLAPGDDLQGHTHRLTLAFDTNVIDDPEGLAYLAPSLADVQTGASFRLAHRAHELDRFIELPWIVEWLAETYTEQAPARLRMAAEDVADEMRENKAHFAHYLNWLSVIGARARLPEIVIRSNARGDVMAPIPVDMVLDVGNSRTCGILIEEHPQQGHGLKNRYELALRDLSLPQQVYAEPFESRIEFAQVVLGKEHCACKSGRNDAFVWPTIARVGPEAARLANGRRGTEGSTGLSSPKRYLWDEDRYQLGWRFNVGLSRDEIEPHATGAPFSNLINDEGNALFDVEDEEKRMPVFMPHYSRSAIMTFMLAEVLTHALVQINSPGQRLKQGDPEKARHLRSIILTVPPSMPKPERDIFANRMAQAMALVWKSLGWHGEDDPMDEIGRATAWPPFPTVHAEWDEATCAQVVYLFSECQEHFAGRPEDFFRVIRRPGRPADGDRDGRRLTLASIDIGGGTTDLVVTDYRLDEGQGANVYITPEQRFRDGFKMAGDDLVLEVVQKLVVPAIEQALRDHGIAEPAPLLSRLIGSEPVSVQESALRQQLALQVLYPLGLAIIKDYEHYDPVARAEVRARTIAEMLVGREPPSTAVLQYVATGVRQSLPAAGDFDLTGVRVVVDLHRLHRFFLEDQMEICKTIQALCEVVWLYDCDMLLLSGRPSRLPGIQALFRALLALPPDRILALDGYRAGTWYPFHKDGKIADPKTTAAVGAMVCKVGGERGIPNFNFLSNAFRAKSTVRYIGLMDRNMRIKSEDIYYRDVRLDDETYDLPSDPFEVRGRMVLGFRQLESDRWGASPLYVLDFTKRAKDQLAKADRHASPVLQVRLKKDRRRRAERFEIAGGVTSDEGVTLAPRDLTLKLNTLNTVGIGETDYWLDSGSVIR
ncbi:MAG: virulence factor SrfB [Rhodospirillales bacterium]